MWTSSGRTHHRIGIQTDGEINLPADLRVDETLSAEALPEILPAYWRASMTGGSTGRPKLILIIPRPSPILPSRCWAADRRRPPQPRSALP